MATVYRPSLETVPNKPEASYRWIDILWLTVSLFFVFWLALRGDLSGFFFTFMILGSLVPDLLCRKFQNTQKTQETAPSIINTSKPLQIACWIFVVVTFSILILAGLGVHPLWDIFAAAPSQFFEHVPLWLFALVCVVFYPVFRVATYIEKRLWLRWVWASAASVIALVILFFQHLGA